VRASYAPSRALPVVAIATVLTTSLSTNATLAEDTVDFDRDVAPLLRARCSKCHSGPKRRGGLSMNTRAGLIEGGESGAALIPGDPTSSTLIARVTAEDRKTRMPPKGDRLAETEVTILTRWIDDGATWTDGFSFAKRHRRAPLAPRRPHLPDIDDVEHPVDRIVLDYLRKHGVDDFATVSDRVFARRAHLDLVGLLPSAKTLQELDDDGAADRFARLVDRLLADRTAYADHWLTFWNDALRNAYRGTGFIDNGRKQITGWLYEALVENRPYDRFVRELIDPVPGSEGFTRGIKWRGVVNESQRPEIQAAQNVAQVFLGTNLKCASCHDSFINDWKLTDAYGFASVFADKPLELHRCDKPTGKPAEVRFLYPELGEISGTLPRKERTRRLAELMTRPENGRLARTIVNRLWAHLLGRGIVEPLDDMDAEPWSQDLLDWLAADLVEHGYDLQHTLRRIVTSRTYRLPSVPDEEVSDEEVSARSDGRIFLGPSVKRLSAEQFVDAVSTLTGLRTPVSGLMRKIDGRGQGGQWAAVKARRGTRTPGVIIDARAVRWIWSSSKASTAAAGETAYFRKTFTLADPSKITHLVATADNELEIFIDGKQVATSETWESPVKRSLEGPLSAGPHTIAARARNAGSAPNPAGFVAFLVGADSKGKPTWSLGSDGSWLTTNEKIEGYQSRELEPEGWRHATELGDIGMAPWNLAGHFSPVDTSDDGLPPARSSLTIANTLVVALGRPGREQVDTRRDSIATLLQALELTNGATLADTLKKGADRWLESKLESRDLVDRIWIRALGRRPNDEERAVVEELVGQTPTRDGVADALWLTLMLPEFQLIH